ncbi:MAG TPA: STAS domain-containing protein [Solirubrobacteraceae bacterium]
MGVAHSRAIKAGGDVVQAYLSVSAREQGESIVIEVDGELDLGSSPQLEQALDYARREEPALVVIDLAKLRFTDMAGLRVLMEAQAHSDREGRRLVLANVPEPVRRVMKLARVNGAFTILENPE